MTWFEAVPIALAAALWLWLPGVAITYALGLRGIAAWGLAPVITVALVASTAVLAAKLGVSWSVWPPLAVTAVVTLAVGASAWLLRRRWAVVRSRDPFPVTLAGVLGLLAAMVLGAITIKAGLGRPDALSQTYDAVFHYNAIALILDTHNGSSLTMANLGNADTPTGFYPAAWHDLVSLLVGSTGTSIPAAANLVTVVVALVVWPLSCLLLARQVFGQSRAALGITGLLSVAFTAFPWALLGAGVLWPNTLGLALSPAILAVVISLTGLAKDDAIGKGRAWLLLPVGVLATGFAHPNIMFTLVVLAIFPVGSAVLRRALRLHRDGRTIRGVAEVIAALTVFGGGWWWAATTPVFAEARTLPQTAFDTPAMAVGEVILNATNQRNALWILSAIVLVGVVASMRTANQRWLVGGHVASGFLYMIAAALPRPGTQMFTGYWYNDAARLAAMLPITGVPLAAAGMIYLARKLADWLATNSERGDWRRRLAALPGVSSLVAVMATLGLGLVVVTDGMNSSDRLARIVNTYQASPAWTLVDPAARGFFARIKDRIPQDSVVAGNPWDGSTLIWALADRKALYPHLHITKGADQEYLAKNLTSAATDPKVCAAINRLRVGYLLIGNSAEFWPGATGRKSYPGLIDPGPKPGFELVDSDGPLKLYRISACTSSPAPVGG